MTVYNWVSGKPNKESYFYGHVHDYNIWLEHL
jgi:hypothetical protein